MKIVLLCGNQPNQVALANKVARRFDLCGIVVEQRKAKPVSKFSFADLVNKVLDRTVFSSIRNSWFELLEYYNNQYPALPRVPFISVSKINADETIEFIKKAQPDVLMVSGTGLIKEKILSLHFPKGIVNLHTGLSPYIKGGPNCTNWCLATNQIHLIGNTIMWIDAGIDSGDIITTEMTSLTGDENLPHLHVKVMEHAHDLYVRSLEAIDKNFANAPHVKQKSIAEGKTYYTRDWGIAQNRKLMWMFINGNYAKTIKASGFIRQREKVVVVELR